MKKLIFILCSLIVVICSGCWPMRMGFENIANSIFSSPQKIPGKITNPIKPNVRLSALWVGHSTVLFQMEDKVIIADPLFEDFVGGIVMRKIEAGLDIKNIPRLDLIIVSHAHMDHLSISSLNLLEDRFPKSALVFPEGAEVYLPGYEFKMFRLKTANSEKRGYIGESITIDSLKVTAVFAEHFGGRYGLDSYSWNVPGYTGYIIEYKDLCIYFGGDTKYDFNAFKKIGERYKINLAVIPIGPCRDCLDEPLEGNPRGHVGPRGALRMLDELHADYMIPVHYGSLQYFNDPNEPVRALDTLIQENPKYAERVKILKEGEQIIFEKRE